VKSPDVDDAGGCTSASIYEVSVGQC